MKGPHDKHFLLSSLSDYYVGVGHTLLLGKKGKHWHPYYKVTNALQPASSQWKNSLFSHPSHKMQYTFLGCACVSAASRILSSFLCHFCAVP